MPSATYKLKFNGYWPEMDISDIPNKSGIYCVYTCNYDIIKDIFFIDRLIYIGESGSVEDRIKNHDLKGDWRKSLRTGQKLYFSFAPIVADRERVEAALIYRHEPEHNMEHKYHFSYDKTEVETSGRNKKLALSFIVR